MASVLSDGEQVTRSWTTAFSLLMGDFDDSEFKVVEWLVFTLSCVINVIIMLNLLIAILSDAYESAQVTMRENDYHQILEVCYELETCCFWRRGYGKPTVLMSCVSGRPDLKNRDKTGKIVQIAKAVKKQLSGIEAKVRGLEDLSGKMAAIEAKVDKLGGLETKLEILEGKISGVDAKLEAIVALLRPSS